MAPWLAVGALWWWSGSEAVWPLLAAAVCLPIAVWAGSAGANRKALAAGWIVVTGAIVVGFEAERQVNFVLNDWDRYWAAQVERVDAHLRREIEVQRLDGGERLANDLMASWVATGAPPSQETLHTLRDEDRVAAIALYESDGTLVAWNGVHRGKVPEEVQAGLRRWSYRDLPLFGYFYLTTRHEDGRVVMVSYLMRVSLPIGLDAEFRNLTTNFFRESGERIRIAERDPGASEELWDFDRDEDRLLVVALDRPAREDRASTIRAAWAVRVALLGGLAWLLFALAARLAWVDAAWAVVALFCGALWAPMGAWAPWTELFDPTFAPLLFGGLPLGRVALLGVGAYALWAVAPKGSVRLPAWTIGVVAAALLPLAVSWATGIVDGAVVGGGRPAWLAVEWVVLTPVALVTSWMMMHVRSDTRSAVALAATGLIAVALGVLFGWRVYTTTDVVPWWTAAWGIPFALGAWALGGGEGWRRRLSVSALATALTASAIVPAMWSLSVEARIVEGESRLDRLNAVEDVELEERLVDFAYIADSLDAVGAEDVAILYDGWRLSGLSQSGYPIRLQIEERDGSPGEGLRIAVAEGEPEPYQNQLRLGREAGGVRLSQLDRDDARYILTAALPDDRMVTAVVPPFPETSGRAGLGPLVRGLVGAVGEELSVIELPEGQTAPNVVARARTRTGWQADVGLRFSNGPAYHAIVDVPLPGLPLTIARAVLILALNLGMAMAFVLLGSALVHDRNRDQVRLSGLVISFRARVTLALFGFFALANAIFGTVAYQALSEASRRSTQVIAERVVDDAAGWYIALDGQMARLASQVGAELLEYRDGELEEGSVEELVDLGLYEGWAPFDVHAELDGYDVVRALNEFSVGRWEYVTAYRRLPDGDVLAAQIPLQAGNLALQTTDLVELLSFVILLGGALSLALAMIAGRALTSPIRALQAASESVGSGDLGLRLPAHRQDEFGAVFRAFNRMVGRVRRARRQLVRTSRRTQLIMDEAAVGMVALDPEGRVTLVNPRAEELLGTEVFVGRHLPADGALGGGLTAWVQEYLAGADDEANHDFPAGDRRVRVRARRLGSFGTRRGVVVALDDVTDELRAERVLAWGEMARQVAHEVKNPLTPIKLSIQHVRRAWDDEHPDFQNILVRNADAMLQEIDRLAEIAQSFSRFGAPGDTVEPLSPVFVADVVAEVMTLYGSATSSVRFDHDLEAGLPPVLARNTELKEVLVNLLENARLAGKDGTRVLVHARRDGEDTVVLSVVDDGAGIPADVLPRIFEPQFSTRSKGTGLGLAIVKRVVTAWGGRVGVTSEPGEGTTVSVRLRVWEGPDGEG